MKKCLACHETIKEFDGIIQTDDGDVYHEECCTVLAQAYSVYVDGDYVGETTEEALGAWRLLSDSEYEVEEV